MLDDTVWRLCTKWIKDVRDIVEKHRIDLNESFQVEKEPGVSILSEQRVKNFYVRALYEPGAQETVGERRGIHFGGVELADGNG